VSLSAETIVFKTLVAPGMLHADVHVDIKRNYNLDSYSLEFCAKHFLKREQKIDFKPQQQFDAFREGSPEKLGKLLDYCFMDVKVTFLLEFSLNIIASTIATASVAWITANMCSTRGQQIHGYSCILQEIKTSGKRLFLSDMKDVVAEMQNFQGATVLTPEKGYYKTPVVVADFASLYPSIIRTYNLSPEAWVKPGTAAPN
jgi:DNA polymerase delta subunit 1